MHPTVEEMRHDIDEGQVLLRKEGRIRLPRIKGDPGHQDQVSHVHDPRTSRVNEICIEYSLIST